MNNKHWILIVITSIILFAVVYYYYYYCCCYDDAGSKKKELFFVDPDSPLNNPFNFPANYKRPSNTVLMSLGQPVKTDIDTLSLPKDVEDEYTEWIDKGLIRTSKDQKSCGGCWAFATTDCLTDRFQIATNGKWENPFGLSAQELLSCGNEMNMQYYQGCNGGLPQFAFQSLTQHGVELDKFDPQAPKYDPQTNAMQDELTSDYTYYQLGDDIITSCSRWRSVTCPCNNVRNELDKKEINTAKATFPIKDVNMKYKAIGNSYLITSHGPNEENSTIDLWPSISNSIIQRNVVRMKKEIYYNGPITAGIRVTDDFYKFVPKKNNYFQYDGQSQMEGGHAVCIVGWKKINGVPVWICRNSWGENWGYGFDTPTWKNPVTAVQEPKYKGGFWNHRMGINDSFIESNCSAGIPDLTNTVIQQFLINTLDKDWHKTKTVRDVFKENQKETPTPTPTTVVTEYKIFTVPFNQMPTELLIDLFKDKNNLGLICSTDPIISKKILELINTMIVVNQESIQILVQKLSKKVSDEIVLALKGEMGVYYYMYGSPIRWDVLDLGLVVNQTTHPEIVSDRVFHQITDLRTNTKIENFEILLLYNTVDMEKSELKIGDNTFYCQCQNDVCQCNKNKNFKLLSFEKFTGMVQPYPDHPKSLNWRREYEHYLFSGYKPSCYYPNTYNRIINDMIQKNT